MTTDHLSGPDEELVTASVELSADERAALRHELSEPYGHDIRIGIFEKLRNSLDAPERSSSEPGVEGELDFNGRNVSIRMADETTATLLGYVVRDSDGKVRVMEREDAEVSRSEVVGSILPSSDIRTALGGDTAREMARRKYETERKTTFCELAPWDKLSDRERASAFFGMQQFLRTAFDLAAGSITETPDA